MSLPGKPRAMCWFFFQAEDGIRDYKVTGVQTCALPISAILTGAKLGWAYAWRALMAGELLFVSLGLGHMLMMGRELADMSQVLAVMLVIIGLGDRKSGV